MSASLCIAACTALCMIISVLFKPYVSIGKFKFGLYVIICFLGAAAELLFGNLPFNVAIKGISADTAVNPLKILALFLSMTLISVYLGDSGFFHLVAEKVFSSGKGKRGKLRLFTVLYVVVSALTVFTSNDIVILTFTPIICIFCKKSGYPPLPFLVGEFVAANTWSMALIVGNPTNVYLAQSANISFSEYFTVMALPALVAGVSAFIVLLAIFGRTLIKEQNFSAQSETATVPDVKVKTDLPSMIAALIALTGCIISLALSDVIGVEMWILTVIFAALLLLYNLIYGLFGEGVARAASGVKKTPWELAPFIISMFIIVLSLEHSGEVATLTRALVKADKTDGVSFGFLAAGLSNLLNNIPTSVITEKIISGTSLSATYGAVIGTNIGAFITPVGALAGIMWNKILSGYSVKLPFYKFALYGITVAAVSLTLSTLTLLLML